MTSCGGFSEAKQPDQNNRISFSTDQLKLIAIIAMVIDHCAIVFVSNTDWARLIPGLRLIGSMTAPIMCFFIAEGYYHTSDLKKYMGRLLGMALISHIPHNLCFGQSILCFWQATSVMVSLLAGLMALSVWNNKKTAVWLKIIAIGGCCLLAYPADWNYIAVLWILGFGIFHGDFRKQMLAFCTVAVLFLLQPFIYHVASPYISRFGIFLVIPLLGLYNGKRSIHHGKMRKWFYYWFYPLHFLVLCGIRLLI